MQTISLFFLTLLTQSAMCQQPPITGQSTTSAATFSNMSWVTGFVIGNTYNISWTSTDTSADAGGSFSAVLKSANSSQTMFAGVVVSPYLWTVPQIAAGEYSMQLLDSNIQTDSSPVFAIVAGAPVVTSTTSSMAMTTTATPVVGTGLGALPSTTTVYWDEPCGCHKTALVPAGSTAVASATAAAAAGEGGSASAGVAGASSASNYTTPVMTTPVTAPYVPGNTAGRVASSWAGLAVAFLGVAFAL